MTEILKYIDQHAVCSQKTQVTFTDPEHVHSFNALLLAIFTNEEEITMPIHMLERVNSIEFLLSLITGDIFEYITQQTQFPSPTLNTTAETVFKALNLNVENAFSAISWSKITQQDFDKFVFFRLNYFRDVGKFTNAEVQSYFSPIPVSKIHSFILDFHSMEFDIEHLVFEIQTKELSFILDFLYGILKTKNLTTPELNSLMNAAHLLGLEKLKLEIHKQISLNKTRIIKYPTINPFQCQFCHQLFTHKFNINDHIRTHGAQSEQSIRCSIDGCSSTFQTERNLKDHIRRMHTENRKHECQQCGKVLASAKTLKSHIKNRHTNNPTIYRCTFPDCNMRYKNQCDLKRHERVHTGNLIGPCRFCGKKFNSEGNFKRHVKNCAKNFPEVEGP